MKKEIVHSIIVDSTTRLQVERCDWGREDRPYAVYRYSSHPLLSVGKGKAFRVGMRYGVLDNAIRAAHEHAQRYAPVLENHKVLAATNKNASAGEDI